MLSEPWRIQLFGTLQAQQDGRVLTRFRTNKAALLLARLALPPLRPYPRDELIEFLWPDDDPTDSRNRLRVELSSLRKQLEPPGIPRQSILVTNRAIIQLNPLAVVTDVSEFHEELVQARHTSDESMLCPHLACAIRLYQGELLPGFYDDWIETERRHLSEIYRGTLHEFTQKLIQRQKYEEALEYGHRLAQIDPYQEEFHCILIQLYITLNQPAAAWQCYRDLEKRLKEDLGIAPASTTLSLVTALGEQNEKPSSAVLSSIQKQHAGTIQTQPAAPAMTTSAILPIDKSEPPGRLPLQFTHFFGRHSEIAQLKRMVTLDTVSNRNEGGVLVTLTGPGGSGKTRLALEVARTARAYFPTGAWFIPLADLTDANQIPTQLQSVLKLQLPHMANTDRVAAISAFLSQSQSLLIFDNLEHLIGGEAIVQALREQTPGLTCLATARRPLGLPGEREFPVLPLPIPPAIDNLISEADLPEQLMTIPSVLLFVDRAQSVRPDFAVTRRNAGDIAAICRRLEGIPLAVELAAARVRALTVTHMRERLSERFDLLVNPQANQAARHRSLRAALEWSYQLLSSAERRLLARLSVFRGGWDLKAAEAVCGEASVLEGLEQMRRNSLILMDEEQEETQEQGETSPRFRMLETMREFGASQISRDEQDELSYRHTRYFLSLVEEADLTGPTRHQWSHRLALEMDNIRVALEWCLSTSTNDSTWLGLRFCHALTRYWKNHGGAREGYQTVCALLRKISEEDASPEDPAYVASWTYAKVDAGVLAWSLGDYEAAQSYLAQTLSEFEMQTDPTGMGIVLHMLGTLRGDQDQIPEACAYLERSLVIRQQFGNKRDIAATLNNLALTLRWSEHIRSVSYVQEARELFREIGDLEGIAASYHTQAEIYNTHGDQAATLSALAESAALFRSLGEKLGMAVTLTKLGRLYWIHGDQIEAHSALREGLLLLYQIGHTQGIAGTLTVIADIIQPAAPARAAQLRGAASRLRKTMLGDSQSLISEGKEWEAGWAMRLEQVIQEAIKNFSQP